MSKFFKRIITILVIFSTSAWNNSKKLDPHLLCLATSHYYEKKYGIPEGLLKSISIVESGRWNKKHNLTLAWPWVLNVEGEGKFFNSYEEAATFLRKALSKGNNVDIGCHQVNWRSHGQYFNKPEELLNPQKNAAYAAYFLKQKFHASQDWNKAIAHYHSQTPQFGSEYLKKVQKVLVKMNGLENFKYSNFLKSKDKIGPIKPKPLLNQSSRTLTRMKTNLMVFSQEVELPSNSVILD
jgi:soluble lytic murein transglycosylase-like protein